MGRLDIIIILRMDLYETAQRWQDNNNWRKNLFQEALRIRDENALINWRNPLLLGIFVGRSGGKGSQIV